MEKIKDDEREHDHDEDKHEEHEHDEHQHACPPVAEGACVPVSLGSKPKQSRRRKLDNLIANTRVPSVLGASFFHLTRRYLAGKQPANDIEKRAFTRLHSMPPELQRVLDCALDSFDSLPQSDKDRLYASEFFLGVNQPLDPIKLTQAFAHEIIGNVSNQVFKDPNAITGETPGKVRTPPFPGGEFPGAPVFVFRVNGLRTAFFLPPLQPGDLTPDEIQQTCHVVLEGSESKQVCEVQTTNCPGQSLGDVCLRVQEVEAGKAVTLEGENFSSIDTKVRLTNVTTFSIQRDVDAFVSGDTETPLTETVNGQKVLITDSRVHDRLTFKIPDDLPPGLYDFQVMVPNEGGDPGWGPVLFSDGVRALEIIPPSTARFQITSETLHCTDETGVDFFGSDEVGIKILGVPLFPDLSSGPVQEPNGGGPIRFDDVDSGETFGMDHLLFSHQQQILGLALVIRGFEIDGEDAFKQQINSFTDAFVDILKDELQFLLDHLQEVEDIAKKLSEAGLTGLIAAAIAVAVVLSIDVIIALWAPADPIIEDAMGPTVSDLVQLTSVNFPLPAPSEYTTNQGIKVKITPLEKIPQQYREKRQYISDDEGSDYDIILRYNRVA